MNWNESVEEEQQAYRQYFDDLMSGQHQSMASLVEQDKAEMASKRASRNAIAINPSELPTLLNFGKRMAQTTDGKKWGEDCTVSELSARHPEPMLAL